MRKITNSQIRKIEEKKTGHVNPLFQFTVVVSVHRSEIKAFEALRKITNSKIRIEEEKKQVT
ncbi:hypothetical protein C8R41DRAFT_830097 [Lentinula lateritia]|uniref:Uncharacterized protein n=1 Tax=Lentinula lateritia TaxID=40482 RepID=A0ABQ8VGX3_9AGAR|nr:hypothetical protein C8R41DRAFT_830097 [Lentinula lateritia]